MFIDQHKVHSGCAHLIVQLLGEHHLVRGKEVALVVEYPA